MVSFEVQKGILIICLLYKRKPDKKNFFVINMCYSNDHFFNSNYQFITTKNDTGRKFSS